MSFSGTQKWGGTPQQIEHLIGQTLTMDKPLGVDITFIDPDYVINVSGEIDEDKVDSIVREYVGATSEYLYQEVLNRLQDPDVEYFGAALRDCEAAAHGYEKVVVSPDRYGVKADPVEFPYAPSEKAIVILPAKGISGAEILEHDLDIDFDPGKFGDAEVGSSEEWRFLNLWNQIAQAAGANEAQAAFISGAVTRRTFEDPKSVDVCAKMSLLNGIINSDKQSLQNFHAYDQAMSLSEEGLTGFDRGAALDHRFIDFPYDPDPVLELEAVFGRDLSSGDLDALAQTKHQAGLSDAAQELVNRIAEASNWIIDCQHVDNEAVLSI